MCLETGRGHNSAKVEVKKSCRRSCPVEANFNSCLLDHQISENAKEGDNVTDKTRVNSGTVTERRILKAA